MTETRLGNQALMSIFWYKGSKINTFVYNILLAFIGSLLIAASAQISIPMEPIYVTLQTFAVMLIGMSLGWRLGFFAVALYLLEGAVGFPVFDGFAGGLPVMFGPNGGYLFAFPIAAAVSGYLVQRGFGRSFFPALFAALVGLALVLIIGASVLAVFIGWHKAYLFGMQMFFLGEVLKAIMLAVIIPKFWKNKS